MTAGQMRPGPHWRWSNVPLPEPFLAAIGAAAAMHVLVPVRLPAGASRLLTGAAMVAGGVALVGWAVHSTADASVDRTDRLVTAGAYRFSRNPMYLGWGAGLLGLSLVTRSAWLLAGTAVAAVVIHEEVRAEERLLARRFGDAYDAYRSRTPRYLPPVARILRGWPTTA